MKIPGTIRNAELTDLSVIVAIAAASSDTPHWTEPQYAQILQKSSDKPVKRSAFVVEVNKNVCGFCVASTVAGSSELENLGVTPTHRRSGLGKLLCQHAMMWAEQEAAGEMWLEVRRSNFAALGLYRVLGFEQTAIRRGYYSDPKDDAVVMRCLLNVATHL